MVDAPPTETFRMSDDAALMRAAARGCPRCGYDQTGAVASWQDVCPLAGVCSECGLHFAFKHVLNPRYWHNSHLFEHATRRQLGALRRTIVRLPIPWALWRRLAMHQQISLWRAAVPVAISAVVLHFAITIVATFTINSWYTLNQPSDLVLTLVWPRVEEGWVGVTPGVWIIEPIWPPVGLMCVGLATLLMPITFLLLPATRRVSRVRWIHLLRVWVYGLALMPLFLQWDVVHSIVCSFVGIIPGYYFLSSRSIAAAIALAAPAAAWMTIWWWVACVRYLKLPRPGWIALLLMVLACLLGVAALMLGGWVWPQLGASWMDQIV